MIDDQRKECRGGVKIELGGRIAGNRLGEGMPLLETPLQVTPSNELRKTTHLWPLAIDANRTA